MRHDSTTLDRFLRRVHRRWIVLRAVESAGVGAAVGCAAALALVPVLLWRDQPAIGVALMLIAVTGAAGLIFGLTRRPTLLAAAVEADRQLALQDLFASALASRGITDEWAGAVVAQAEARCRDLSPDAILLNRFGVRAWSGIGLAAALVMTLSLLSSHPEPLSASDAANVSRRSARRAPSIADVPPAITARDANSPRSSTPPVESRDPLASDPARHDSSASNMTSNDNASGSSSGSTGTGLGAARTDDAASRDGVSLRDPSSQSQDTSNAIGDASSGGRGAGELPRGDRRDVFGSGADTGSREPVAPWTSPAWSDAQREARDAIESGRVPDAYRELIRAYFAPEQE